MREREREREMKKLDLKEMEFWGKTLWLGEEEELDRTKKAKISVSIRNCEKINEMRFFRFFRFFSFLTFFSILFPHFSILVSLPTKPKTPKNYWCWVVNNTNKNVKICVRTMLRENFALLEACVINFRIKVLK